MPQSCKESPLSSLLLSKKWCCNAALVHRQTRNRVTLSSRWESWMSFPLSSCFRYRWCWMPCTTCLQKICRDAKRESCMLSHCYNRWGSVQTCKTHLPTFKPPAPRHTQIWRCEYMNNRFIHSAWQGDCKGEVNWASYPSFLWGFVTCE